jgi:hypothetical protein
MYIYANDSEKEEVFKCFIYIYINIYIHMYMYITFSTPDTVGQV